MPLAPRPALAVAVGLAALAGVARTAWPASPYHATAPDPGPCDVVVDDANAATTLAELNDPDKRVFCVEPGDYRSAGLLRLTASGTEASPRFLRFHADDGVANALERPERAVFHALKILGSWWVIQGLTIQPRDPDESSWFVAIQGGDRNLIEGNLVDGSEHDNQGAETGIIVTAALANPASYNVIQDNVVSNGNRNRLAVDYMGIRISAGDEPGADNDYNRVLDNEVYDWGDGIGLAGHVPDCNFPGVPHGTVIDGNDVYITGNKRIDCATGAPDPDGDCACAENGIDIKPDPGPDPALWTRVTNNRLWGFRPTREPSICGGSGSNGQAITAGNSCPRHVLAAGNIVLDAKTGIKPGSEWIVAGNLFHDVEGAIRPQGSASGLEIEFNTITGVDNAYDDVSSDTDTRCNVVVDNLALAGDAGPRGTNQVTEYNFLYHSPPANFEGPTNEMFTMAKASRNAPFCFLRKRWTTPEWLCIPFGWTTGASPHAAAMAHCGPDLGAAFGLRPIAYDSIGTVPEPGATQLATWALIALALRACRARVRPPSSPRGRNRGSSGAGSCS
jgi:hypothetical protein